MEKSIIKEKLQKNISKIYLLSILSGVYFSIPVIVLFWQENGLSMTEIMVLQSIFALLIVILEVPTGYFADRYGRKNSLLITGISLSIGMTVYFFGYNFLQFLIAEIFFAVAAAFSSGAKSAFVYDTLLALHREKEYKRIWGNATYFTMLSLAISSVCGGIIGDVDLRYTLFASIPFFCLMIPIVLSLYEPSIQKLIVQEKYRSYFAKILQENILNNKKLRWIIIYSSIVYGFNQASVWMYQPYFSFSGVDVVYFGVIFASFQIVAAISSKYAHVLEEKLGEKFSLVMMIFLVSLSFFLMSNFVFLFSFSFAFLQQFIRGFRVVVISDYINKLTKSNVRATILSIESFIGRSLYALIIPFIGIIIDAYTIVEAFMALSIVSLCVGGTMICIFRKYRII